MPSPGMTAIRNLLMTELLSCYPANIGTGSKLILDPLLSSSLACQKYNQHFFTETVIRQIAPAIYYLNAQSFFQFRPVEIQKLYDRYKRPTGLNESFEPSFADYQDSEEPSSQTKRLQALRNFA